MHVHFEETLNTRSDCVIQALSWMGKVPDILPEEDGWKLNRNNYYQEGWLATGNVKGIVGATFTTCHCKKNFDMPPRMNFNLRGHRAQVMLVKWNEPYQKLATCDANGIIFVWIKYEGRWSIELINDRNIPVTDFTWSHDGRMALICYRDGFVLVGSVAGQRYWSSMLNLEFTHITCGVWTPDDKLVLFGTADGQIIVMDVHGAMITQVTVCDGQEITGMAWSCEHFNMDETDSEDRDMIPPKRGGVAGSGADKSYSLAVCLKFGAVYIMKNYDDVCPIVIHAGLHHLHMDWSNNGEILALGGFVRQPNLECKNFVKFYSSRGHLRYSIEIKNQVKPITALTWGHNDKRLFVAAGTHIHVAWVTRKIATLQLMCRRTIQLHVHEESVGQLPLPTRLKNAVLALFSPTIRGYIPDPHRLREFVSTAPPNHERLHCTMIRTGDELSSSDSCFTLYLEYLGGLVPLLKGKRISRIKPEFVVYDPKTISSAKIKSVDEENQGGSSAEAGNFSSTEISDSDDEYEPQPEAWGSGSPNPRRGRRRRLSRGAKRAKAAKAAGAGLVNGSASPGATSVGAANDLVNDGATASTSSVATAASPAAAYSSQCPNLSSNQRSHLLSANSQSNPNSGRSSPVPPSSPRPSGESSLGGGSDVVKETSRVAGKLVHVTSNIWGTKFKIHGLAAFLPSNLGNINYKTSLLHLQPRQMTVIITELRNDLEPDRDPAFNPNIFSEDEEEARAQSSGTSNGPSNCLSNGPANPKANGPIGVGGASAFHNMVRSGSGGSGCNAASPGKRERSSPPSSESDLPESLVKGRQSPTKDGTAAAGLPNGRPSPVSSSNTIVDLSAAANDATPTGAAPPIAAPSSHAVTIAPALPSTRRGAKAPETNAAPFHRPVEPNGVAFLNQSSSSSLLPSPSSVGVSRPNASDFRPTSPTHLSTYLQPDYVADVTCQGVPSTARNTNLEMLRTKLLGIWGSASGSTDRDSDFGSPVPSSPNILSRSSSPLSQPRSRSCSPAYLNQDRPILANGLEPLSSHNNALESASVGGAANLKVPCQQNQYNVFAATQNQRYLAQGAIPKRKQVTSLSPPLARHDAPARSLEPSSEPSQGRPRRGSAASATAAAAAANRFRNAENLGDPEKSVAEDPSSRVAAAATVNGVVEAEPKATTDAQPEMNGKLSEAEEQLMLQRIAAVGGCKRRVIKDLADRDPPHLCASKLLENGLRNIVHNGGGLDSLAKWADQACNGLKFIDEDYEDDSGIIRIRPTPTPTNENRSLESTLRSTLTTRCAEPGRSCICAFAVLDAGGRRVVSAEVEKDASLPSPVQSPPHEPYNKCATVLVDGERKLSISNRDNDDTEEDVEDDLNGNLRNIVFEPEAVHLNAEDVRQAMEKRRRLMSNASSINASLGAVSPTPSAKSVQSNKTTKEHKEKKSKSKEKMSRSPTSPRAARDSAGLRGDDAESLAASGDDARAESLVLLSPPMTPKRTSLALSDPGGGHSSNSNLCSPCSSPLPSSRVASPSISSCDESASDVSTLIMNTSAPESLGGVPQPGGGVVVFNHHNSHHHPPNSHHPTSNPSSPFSGRRGDRLRAGDSAAKPIVANLSRIASPSHQHHQHHHLASHHHRVTSPARRPAQVAVGAPDVRDLAGKGVPVLKNKVQSPLLPHRRLRSSRPQESSDEEMLVSEDELGEAASTIPSRNAPATATEPARPSAGNNSSMTCQNYKNLETFQKAHIQQKLKQKKHPKRFRSKSGSCNSAKNVKGKNKHQVDSTGEASCSECGSESGADCRDDAGRRSSTCTSPRMSPFCPHSRRGGRHAQCGAFPNARSPSPSCTVSPNSSAAEDEAGAKHRCHDLEGCSSSTGATLHYHCGHPNRPSSPGAGFPRVGAAAVANGPSGPAGAGRGALFVPCCPCQHHRLQQRREFVMHNKAPLWNETSQVYQLDFGGRVTQESAKNFQIEFKNRQVMQFGRIDSNAYTLDFQYPFTAIQAFAVALANVTQRLK